MDRLKIFQIIIILVAAIIIGRLFYWQFLNKVESKSPLAQDEIPAPRGEIFTRDGFPLVANQEAFLLYAKPKEIKDQEQAAKALAPYLISEKYATSEAELSENDLEQKQEEIEKKEEEIQRRLGDKSLFWVQIARKVPLLVKEFLEAKNIKGIGFEPDQKRYYPEASMAARLLGFVGSDQFGQDTGYFGLEGYYDRKLRGKAGKLGLESDPLGLPILVGKYKPQTPEKGSSLYLSLDRVIQFIVEDKLAKAVERYGAKSGTVIIANPKTGKITAMATFPTYNPGLRLEFSEDQYRNPAVADSYEPGSTFKLITMSAALDLGLVDPNTRCNVCSGPRKIGGFEISTWNKKYYPDSTISEVIIHSDNVGMTFVSEKLGLDSFYDYIIKFGFDRPTGIDLQEETSGTIRRKQEWRQIDLATASFGQGLAVTPIQMVQAVSAIANGGKLISPKVVDYVKNSKGEIEKIEPDNQRQVISKKAAAQITEMMVSAVENGEAKAFAPQGYRIAGKTGTAQIPLAGHYDPNKTIASFVGFAPANDPKFVMLVLFNQPSASPFGSETAAPTFFEIAKEIFNYWGITPKN